MEIIPVTAKLKYFSNIKQLILNIYFLIIHQLEKNSFESDFSYIISVPLLLYLWCELWYSIFRIIY